MPVDFRRFKKEIERSGYFVEPTRKGHYWVITSTGGKLLMFAITHRKNSKGGEVLDCYVNKVRNEIKKNESRGTI